MTLVGLTHNLFDKKPSAPKKTTINPGPILNDIKSGMSRTDLMNKHKLSEDNLKKFIELMVKKGHLEKSEISYI